FFSFQLRASSFQWLSASGSWQLGAGSYSLPNVAEDFAADARAHRGAPGHDAARRRQNARAQPAEHRRHVAAAKVHAAAGAADALDAGDDFFTARPVFQVDANELPRHLHLLGDLLVDHLEALNVALVFENPGNLDLQSRGRHIHPRMLRNDGIPEAREHIGNGVCHMFVFLVASSVRLPATSFQLQNSQPLAARSWQLGAPFTSYSSSLPRCRLRAR